MFIKSDSWEYKNLSTMKTLSALLGCAPGSVRLQARLPLARFCNPKSHYYTNVSLETLITKLVEKFKMKKNWLILKAFSVYRFWKKKKNVVSLTQFANILIQNVLLSPI